MQIRKADGHDIDLLVTLRIDYLLVGKGKLLLEEESILKAKLKEYFSKHIDNGFLAVIAQAGDEVLSTAFLSIVERPPRAAFSSYLVGTVYNVFTYPQHRRKGIATRVMKALLREAESAGVASVDLLATADGRPLYEKLGFQIANYTAMKKKL